MGCKCSRDVRDNDRSSPDKISGDIRGIYKIGKTLGTGAFGQVRECMNRETKEVFAMKIMEKTVEKGHWSNENMFRREVQVLGMLDHPNIVKYHAFFEDNRYLYAIIEKCDGGELFESILKLGTYPEKRAASLCLQMLDGLAYLHAADIVHRDIKAENYLFLSTDTNSPIKLIDFGMSARLNKGQMLTDICGSPHYLSPELIRRKYSFKADIWALGVLLYLMIYGKYPFDGNNTSAIVKMILTKRIEWHTNSVKPSEQAISFMRMLLQRNPDKRPTAPEAARHIWLTSSQSGSSPCYTAPALTKKSSVAVSTELPLPNKQCPAVAPMPPYIASSGLNDTSATETNSHNDEHESNYVIEKDEPGDTPSTEDKQESQSLPSETSISFPGPISDLSMPRVASPLR